MLSSFPGLIIAAPCVPGSGSCPFPLWSKMLQQGFQLVQRRKSKLAQFEPLFTGFQFALGLIFRLCFLFLKRWMADLPAPFTVSRPVTSSDMGLLTVHCSNLVGGHTFAAKASSFSLSISLHLFRTAEFSTFYFVQCYTLVTCYFFHVFLIEWNSS